MNAGEMLEDFKRRYPKQHKPSAMLYGEKYKSVPVSTISVHQIIVSDEGEFQFKNVFVNHPNKSKTPMEWRRWLDKHYRRILIAVIEATNKETGQLWKVRAILGWTANASKREGSAMAKRKRNKTSKKRRK